MNETDYVKILSFDPGLSNSGYTLSHYKLKTGEFIIQQCGMMFPNKTVGMQDNRDSVSKYGSRIVTLDMLRMEIRNLINEYQPDFVVSEDAFYNPTRPTAYCALIQWLTTVELLLHDEFQFTLFKLAPKIAKQVVSGFGGAEKLGVQHAVLNHQYIKFKKKMTEVELTEHMCDSIGVGWTFTQEILPAVLPIWRSFNVSKTS